MKYEVEINANDSITPHTIFAVNGPMVARAVTLAEADFIVRACNSHDQLVEALQLVMTWIDNWGPDFIQDPEWASDRTQIDAALAAAEAA